MKIKEENIVRLSVRELVEFVLKEGDIDNRRGAAAVQDAMLLGAAAHRRIQRSMGADYQAEVALKVEIPLYEEIPVYEKDQEEEKCSEDAGITLETEISPEMGSLSEAETSTLKNLSGTEFTPEEKITSETDEPAALLMVDGRADGIVSDHKGTEKAPGETTIDEIKGVYRDVQKIEEPDAVHLAQAEMYAWVYAVQENLSNIHVQITYVQLEEDEQSHQPKASAEIHRFLFSYTREEITEKALGYVEMYRKWALFIVRHRKERKESVNGFSFPFDYRPGQKKIVSQAYRTMESGGRLFVQAPTGIGKTLAMLYPAVQAVGRDLGDKIFYLTAKTVTGTVAEEGMKLMNDRGLRFSFVKITARDKMCPLDERKCDPVHCERAKGHLSRVNEAVYDIITHESAITAEKVAEYAEKHCVCPYEFSLDISYYVDVIIGDYNYAFAPHVYLKRYFADGRKGEYLFLIDEAHNLVDRARDMYSAVLHKEDLLAAKKLFPNQKTILKWLDRANKTMLAMKRECEKVTVFTEENFPNSLIYELMSLREAISRYLDNTVNPPNNDQMTEFFFEIADFLDTYEVMADGYLSYASFEENNAFYVKLFCIDPAARLAERLENVNSTIFFSATFLPITYYKELLVGDKSEDAIYVDSPFDREKREILISRDISSRYTQRGSQSYRRMAEYILAMVRKKKGNYLVFFPSHRFLEDVKEVMENEFETEFELIAQKRVMSEDDRQEFLKKFEENRNIVGLSVLGGVFSEGIDLKNDSLIGVAVVGTGLPQVCVERELIRDYYEGKGENGFDYSYRYPGFNKVMQAAGRLIRTDEDRGIILLLDERFTYSENRRLFPKEWDNALSGDFSEIDEKMRDFWKKIE